MRYIPLYRQERKCLSRLVGLAGMWLTRLELINSPYLEIKKREQKVNISISEQWQQL